MKFSTVIDQFFSSALLELDLLGLDLSDDLLGLGLSNALLALGLSDALLGLGLSDDLQGLDFSLELRSNLDFSDFPGLPSVDFEELDSIPEFSVCSNVKD